MNYCFGIKLVQGKKVYCSNMLKQEEDMCSECQNHRKAIKLANQLKNIVQKASNLFKTKKMP